MQCRQCGNTLPQDVAANEQTTDRVPVAANGGGTLCFFCLPENDGSRADRQVWMDAADKVAVSPTPPPTPKRWSGTITIVDDDWERLDETGADPVVPKKKARDYYAVLDEPDAFDERAWLTFMGAEYAIEHLDGPSSKSDSSAA